MALQLAVCLENAQYTELLNGTEFNNQVLRALGSGIMVVDPNGIILYLNRAALEIFEKAESQMLGRPIADFPEMSDFAQGVKNTLAHGKPEDRYELQLKLPGGSVTVGMSTSLLVDHAEKVTGVVINFRNLGAFRKFEEQMRRAHYLEALGQMAAGVAHEIRNPLNSVRGFTQLVFENERNNNQPRVHAHYSRRSRPHEPHRPGHARFFAPAPAHAAAVVNRQTLAGTSSMDVRTNAEQARVTVEILEPGEELPNVHGNRDKLRQVFRNIIINAIQACKPGGSISIGFQPVMSKILDPRTKSLDRIVTVREVAVHVNDTGCGISSEVMRRIFDPFFTQKEKGTGLGLSISQKIMEQHHGRIEVQRRAGRRVRRSRCIFPRSKSWNKFNAAHARGACTDSHFVCAP